MEKLLIFPYNGNGIEALDCIGNQFEFIGFVDDTNDKMGENKFGQIVYNREVLKKISSLKIIAVPGSPTSYLNRKKIIKDLKIPESNFATLIHPAAIVSPLATIGYNVLIMAGVVITANAVIGNHVVILPNTVIHHDCIIEDHTLIGANVTVAGNTIIEENCYIGSGTSIINNIVIGKQSLVGIGSNVIKSIPLQSKVAGNPAKPV